MLLLFAGFIAVTGTAAYVLAGRRDLGTGLIRPRPGPAEAAGWLRSPLALAWRLQRGSLIAWTAGFFLVGLVMGNIAADVGNILDSENAREIVTRMGGVQGMTDAFLAAELGILSVVASAYGVQAALLVVVAGVGAGLAHGASPRHRLRLLAPQAMLSAR